MPELLKNVYTEEYLQQLALAIGQVQSSFARRVFVQQVLAAPWEALALKARMRKISQCLRAFLPEDYRHALTILQSVAPAFHGLPAMIFPDFVECFGLDDYEASIAALAIFTEFSSSEFAIRPFIVRYPQTLNQMQGWADSDNHHHRRLASEGCRPRLPWAMALPQFKKDPQAILPILEKLRADPSLYVRKSVANNLNDISKDHPQIVLDIAQRWLGQGAYSDWIVRHACRTLLKRSDAITLALFGFADAPLMSLQDFYCDQQVVLGDTLQFSLTLQTCGMQLGKLRVEYHLHFLRSRGDYGKKVFHWFEGEVLQPQKKLTKFLRLQPLTTRRYCPGQQHLAAVVNGVEMRRVAFDLVERTA
jgi:3-methyladenine DNA glycosylase AlkC